MSTSLLRQLPCLLLVQALLLLHTVASVTVTGRSNSKRMILSLKCRLRPLVKRGERRETLTTYCRGVGYKSAQVKYD